jgi:2-keto-4-pentenoate hydratase/2-oxohepta-3-ene-1,7-dioic acid hydratase in catechol pathway
VTEVAYGSPGWSASAGAERFRRSVYTFSKRTAPFAFYNTFDAPVGDACVARRDVSNTPLQGLTLLNDVSMRDFQRRSLQFFAGKTWEGCTPCGPAVVTLDELPNLADREIVTRVNGEERQRAPISDLIFDIPTLIETCSRGITLYPGDVIATGSPAGVGMGFDPPRWLRSGDVVRIEIDGIGAIENRFQ